MLSEKTKEKMLIALNSTIRLHPEDWDERSIEIVTSAINYGKELRGYDRKSIGHAIDTETHKLADVFVLEGNYKGTPLAVQIGKKNAFNRTNFSFSAYELENKYNPKR